MKIGGLTNKLKFSLIIGLEDESLREKIASITLIFIIENEMMLGKNIYCESFKDLT